MKDTEANVALIKHINQRIEEFFEEYPQEDFASLRELQIAFARYVRLKERGENLPKVINGAIAQHMYSEDVVDDHSGTLGMIKFFTAVGRIGIMWSPVLFVEAPMPDDVREMLVAVLRFHADKLESRDLDREMQRIHRKQSGAA